MTTPEELEFIRHLAVHNRVIRRNGTLYLAYPTTPSHSTFTDAPLPDYLESLVERGVLFDFYGEGRAEQGFAARNHPHKGIYYYASNDARQLVGLSRFDEWDNPPRTARMTSPASKDESAPPNEHDTDDLINEFFDFDV